MNLAQLAQPPVPGELALHLPPLGALPHDAVGGHRIVVADRELQALDRRRRVGDARRETVREHANPTWPADGPCESKPAGLPTPNPWPVEEVDLGRAAREQRQRATHQQAPPQAIQADVGLAHVGKVFAVLATGLGFDRVPGRDVRGHRRPRRDVAPQAEPEHVGDEAAAHATALDRSLRVAGGVRDGDCAFRPEVEAGAAGDRVAHAAGRVTCRLRIAVTGQAGGEAADATVDEHLPAALALDQRLLGGRPPRGAEQRHRGEDERDQPPPREARVRGCCLFRWPHSRALRESGQPAPLDGDPAHVAGTMSVTSKCSHCPNRPVPFV